MRVIQQHDSYPTSPVHDRTLDLEDLDRLLVHKPQRGWSVDTRESTPEAFQSRHPHHGPLEYWKDLAAHNERQVRSLDTSQDHRMSISSVEYWRTEAEHLNQRYWSLVQQMQTKPSRKRRKRSNGATYKVKKQIHFADGPISSRLRNSHIQSRPSSTPANKKQARNKPHK